MATLQSTDLRASTTPAKGGLESADSPPPVKRAVSASLMLRAAVSAATMTTDMTAASLAGDDSGYESDGGVSVASSVDALTAKEEEERAAAKKAEEQALFLTQVVFVYSVTNVGVTMFLLGYSSIATAWYYSIKCVLLLAYRFYTFRKAGQHWYLADFCYYANFMLVAWLWAVVGGGVGREAEHEWWVVPMFRFLFAASNGPLAWAIVTFSNRLNFTSIQHMISVMIHVSPALVTFAARWASPQQAGLFGPITALLDPNQPKALGGRSGGSDVGEKLLLDWGLLFRDTYFPFYLVWIVVYALVVFVACDRCIADNKHETLYSYVMSKPSPVRSLLRRASSIELVRKIIYLLIHAVFAAFTILPTFLFYNIYWLHFAFIAFICVNSIWNASRTFARYSHEYMKNRKKKREKKKEVGEERGGGGGGRAGKVEEA